MGKWDPPGRVSQIALGATLCDMNMYVPTWEEIPEEYKRPIGKWQAAANRIWLGGGLPQLVVKPGIDSERAVRHMYIIAHAWEVPLKHKIAAMAYLLSVWFDHS